MNDRRVTAITASVSFLGLGILGAYLYRPDLPLWESIPSGMRNGFSGLLLMHGICLFWLPMMTLLLILQESPDKFGLTLGDWKKNHWWVLGLFLAVLPFLVIAARMPVFRTNYPYYCPAAANHHLSLLYYELAQGLYFFIWEFFFRGFLLFGIARSLKNWSLLIGAAIFTLFHVGKPMPELIGSFPTALILGWVSLKCKSFIPAYLVHWMAAASFDLLVLGFAGRLF